MHAASNQIILVVVNQAWVTYKFRARLIETIRAHGYRVAVLTQADDSFEKLRPICDELIPFRITPRSINPWHDILTTIHAFNVIRRLRPYAVLTFTIKPNIYVSLVCHWLGIPVINNVTGLGSMGQQRGARRWLLFKLYRFAFSRSNRVFFQNSEDQNDMIRHGLVDSHVAQLLPGSGVDTDRFKRRAFHATERDLVFCMAARLLVDKGVREYAKAAQIIRREYPGTNFHLWGFVEKDDPRFVGLEEIREWERLNILTFRGEARDALQAFEDVDCVVLPSYYPEGLPRTLLEAGSMSLPAITTDTPGCRDAIVHGLTGLLCAARDIESLCCSMRNMILMPSKERRQMGEAARAYVVANFDERVVLDAYLREIENVSPAPR